MVRILATLSTVAEGSMWLSVEEAAKVLRFHPNTVYRLTRDGQLPALRFPGADQP